LLVGNSDAYICIIVCLKSWAFLFNIMITLTTDKVSGESCQQVTAIWWLRFCSHFLWVAFIRLCGTDSFVLVVVLLELTWALPSKCYCGFSLQSPKYDLKDVAIWECISGTLQEREYEIKYVERCWGWKNVSGSIVGHVPQLRCWCGGAILVL
jgi:hypothetical protein